MWPTISNIDSTIAEKIKSYPNNLLKASELNAWVRVFSGAERDGYKGLIMESNTNWKLFNAAGEGGGSIYGNPQQSGTLGRDWEGKAVNAGVGRGLRPSPIITSLNSKEGKDQISRTCDFSITCFSLEQLEYMQSYFMEPGYSVGVEWGWNTINGVSGLIPTGTVDGVLNGVADTTLNNGELSEKRLKTLGEYDVFLGFIVGSTISNDGENFKIEVRLRGAPSLPTYLQSQNRIKTKVEDSDIDTNKVEPFDTSKLVSTNDGTSSKRRFRLMFNQLPQTRKISQIKKKENDASLADFVNMDKFITNQINGWVDETKYFGLSKKKTAAVEINNILIDLEREKLFSDNRYIRFELAMDILNESGGLSEYKVGDKVISFKINIKNSVIGAFPNIYSTKASKLLIAGTIPDFSNYFLAGDEIIQLPNGVLKVSNNEISPKPTSTPLLKSFVETKDLNLKIGTTKNTSQKKLKLKEKGGYYGYIKNLYVNFDMFVEKIQQPNKTITEVLLDVLNEMSSAVNGFWNFQIVETETDSGDIEITIIDENWIGENPEPDRIVVFQHNGLKTPFLSSNLDISIPSELASKIVMERLGQTSQQDLQNISVKAGSLFESNTDLFISKINQVTGSLISTGSAASDSTDESDDVKKLNKLIKTREDKIVGSGTPSKTEPDAIDFFDANGFSIKRVSADGSVKYFGGGRKGEFRPNKEIYDLEAKIEKDIKAAEIQKSKDRIFAYLNLIDIIPNPKQIAFKGDTDKADITTLIKDTKNFLDKFSIHCFDDTDFFDKIRNNAFENKYENSNTVKGLSHPLPIKYTFTILGNSGIRRGDTFNIDGIPEKYKKSGLFQVTEIEHTLSDMKWTTTITGQYRQIQ
jgi:hypothetical protein